MDCVFMDCVFMDSLLTRELTNGCSAVIRLIHALP